MKDWVYEKQPCGHYGYPSVYGPFCTACANELRRKEFAKDHSPPPKLTLLDRFLRFFHYLGQ